MYVFIFVSLLLLYFLPLERDSVQTEVKTDFIQQVGASGSRTTEGIWSCKEYRIKSFLKGDLESSGLVSFSLNVSGELSFELQCVLPVFHPPEPHCASIPFVQSNLSSFSKSKLVCLGISKQWASKQNYKEWKGWGKYIRVRLVIRGFESNSDHPEALGGQTNCKPFCETCLLYTSPSPRD